MHGSLAMVDKKSLCPEQIEMLDEHLPYRLQLLDGLCWACSVLDSSLGNSSLSLSLSGAQVNFPDARPLTNALAESGILYCRVLLNFLGIHHNNGKFTEYNPREDDFTIANLGLQIVTTDKLKSDPPTGNPDDIERACLNMLRSANKAVAHFTTADARACCNDAACCAKTVMWLIEKYVYRKLGREVPAYKIWTNQ
ncbi:hypothetical protein Deba_2272 [Desulfarculus baarsii DSM 2075]|uniref:Uncharacterized protein n=2 Tax=Desulfarculus baarsii TaxID=453230 RepID=E1QJ92_DESB2|nr:hypothetical protein Deba_2272 [Desulfarculus baarsii DSM 2075]